MWDGLWAVEGRILRKSTYLHIRNGGFMQRTIWLGWGWFLGALLWAQPPTISISASSDHVTVGRGDSVALIINAGNADLQIKRIVAPDGTVAFRSVPTFLPAGTTDTIWMTRNPVHNIQHVFPVWIITARQGVFSMRHQYQGVYADSAYYKPTRNLWDHALKQALKQIITQNHTTLSYSAARDKMFMMIDNWRVNGRGANSNKVECVYTGRVVTGYSSRYDVQNQGFNTEHTFPQSKFGGGEPMRSDLFHLFPTDAGANSARGNLPFGEVITPTWSMGGSKKDYNKFEPRDAQKGPAARALFYFVVRYYDYSGFVAPQENVLRTWHKAFPPNSVEKRRNSDIYAIQHNRNPFIDHPEFVDRIYSIAGSATRPATVSLHLPADTVVIELPLVVDTLKIPFWVTGGMVQITSIDYDTSYFTILAPSGPVMHQSEGWLRMMLKPDVSAPLTSPITLVWGNMRRTTFYVDVRRASTSYSQYNRSNHSCCVILGSRGAYIKPGMKIRRLQFFSTEGRELLHILHPRAGYWIAPRGYGGKTVIVRWIEDHQLVSKRLVLDR